MFIILSPLFDLFKQDGGCGECGSAGRGPHTKPEIYRTNDGRIVVEDEILNFLAVKMRIMTQDEIVTLAANTFDSEWIEASKRVLFEVCSTTQRCVSHKGAQKDANNIKSCLKVLNECGENVPRFVSHYLDELPPITFTNLDVSSLLVKLERLKADVCSMKRAMQLQVNISEETRAITADLDRRVAAMEDPTNRAAGEGLVDSSEIRDRPGAVAESRNVGDASPGAARERALVPADRSGTPATAVTAVPGSECGLPAPATHSPAWSQIVRKKGRHPKTSLAAQPTKTTRISETEEWEWCYWNRSWQHKNSKDQTGECVRFQI